MEAGGGEEAGATEGVGEAKRRRTTERDREKGGEELQIVICTSMDFFVFSLFVVAVESCYCSSCFVYFCVQAAQRELERQRKEEWERGQRGELQIKKEQEQDDIVRLKAKKRSLEMELEAVVSCEMFLEVYFSKRTTLDTLWSSLC